MLVTRGGGRLRPIRRPRRRLRPPGQCRPGQLGETDPAAGLL